MARLKVEAVSPDAVKQLPNNPMASRRAEGLRDRMEGRHSLAHRPGAVAVDEVCKADRRKVDLV